MSNQRYDVVLRALNGPLASLGEQKFQGPLVRIGTNPGPGGFQLTGYRGIDARQCVITAYGEGEATVGPVGNNQVRMAPHAHVKWKDIDPLTQPEYLNAGCAIHLGPVGRGATIEFARVEKLGVWTGGRVGSAVDNVEAVAVSEPVAAARKAAPRRSVARIAAATLPIWFLGCVGLVAAVLVVVLVIVGINPLLQVEVEKLGPIQPGEEYYDSVKLDETEIDEVTLEGLQEGFRRFVAKPSKDAADEAGAMDVSRITDPQRWDERFFQYTSASVAKHVQSKAFFKRLDAIHKPYAGVVSQLREANLPEVMAAVPYAESRYRPELQSWACAKGYWQFMPEMAHRLNVRNGVDFRVKDCQLRRPDGSTFLWTPTALTPPNGIMRNAVYVDKQSGLKVPNPDICMIPQRGGCRIDDRADLGRSTNAAIVALKEAWEDETLAASGSGVAITILSHNGGYNDRRYGVKKSFNLLPAFKTWSAKKSEAEHHLFYGENIKCPDGHGNKFCGSRIHPQTQHYAYSIVSQHLLAVCYYGKNYEAEYEAFRNWQTVLDGYCASFAIPTKETVKGW